MGSSANVQSIEAIKRFRVAFANLVENSRRGLDSTRMDIRRFLDWLQTDQANHWKSEIKRREKELAQAKADLHRKRLSGATKDSKPDVTEQKMALRRAQARVEEAEGKIKRIKKWSQILDKAVREYEGQARQLAGMVEVDAQKSLALLDQMLDSLDAYTRLSAPSAPRRSAAGASESDQGADEATGVKQSTPAAEGDA
jgi:hypothetical protein